VHNIQLDMTLPEWIFFVVAKIKNVEKRESLANECQLYVFGDGLSRLT